MFLFFPTSQIPVLSFIIQYIKHVILDTNYIILLHGIVCSSEIRDMNAAIKLPKLSNYGTLVHS